MKERCAGAAEMGCAVKDMTGLSEESGPNIDFRQNYWLSNTLNFESKRKVLWKWQATLLSRQIQNKRCTVRLAVANHCASERGEVGNAWKLNLQ